MSLIAQKRLHVVVQKTKFHNVGYILSADEVVQRTINTLENMDSSFVVTVCNGALYAVCINKEPNLVVKIHRTGRIKLSPTLIRVKTTRAQRQIIRNLASKFKKKAN